MITERRIDMEWYNIFGINYFLPTAFGECLTQEQQILYLAKLYSELDERVRRLEGENNENVDEGISG